VKSSYINIAFFLVGNLANLKDLKFNTHVSPAEVIPEPTKEKAKLPDGILL